MADGDRELKIVIRADGTLANATLDETKAKGEAAATGTAQSWTTGFATIATGINQAREIIGAAWEGVSSLVEKGIADNKQEEEGVISLTTALAAHGHAITANVEASKQYADAAMKRFALDDDEILKLEAIGAQYGLTGKDIQTFAEDSIAVSERTGKSIEASGLMVEKAMGGSTKAFHGLGVEIDTTGTKADVLSQIHDKLSGSISAAEEKAQGYEGQLKLLNAQYENLLGSLAKLVTQNPDLLAALKGTEQGVGDLVTAVDSWRTGMVDAQGQSHLTAQQVRADFDDMAADVVEFSSLASNTVKTLWDNSGTVVGTELQNIGIAAKSALDALNTALSSVHLPTIDTTGLRDFVAIEGEVVKGFAAGALAAEDAQTKASAFALSLRDQAEAARTAISATDDLTGAFSDQYGAISGDSAGAGGDISKAAKGKKGAAGGKNGLIGAIADLDSKYASLSGTQRDVKGSTSDKLYGMGSTQDMQDYVAGLMDQLTGSGMSQSSATSFIDKLGLPASSRTGGAPVGTSPGAYGGTGGGGSVYQHAGGPGWGVLPFTPGQGGRNGAGTYDPSIYPGSNSGGIYHSGGGAGIEELLTFYLAKGLITQQQHDSHLVDPHEGQPGNFFSNQAGLVPYGSSPGKPAYVQWVGSNSRVAEQALNATNAGGR